MKILFTPSGRQESAGVYFSGVLRVDWATFIAKPKLFRTGLHTDLVAAKFGMQPNYTVLLRKLYLQKLIQIKTGKRAAKIEATDDNISSCFGLYTNRHDIWYKDNQGINKLQVENRTSRLVLSLYLI